MFGKPYYRCLACTRRNWNEKHYPALKERNRKDPDGYKQRWRASKLKQLYGLSFEEYAAMFEKQQGACAICKKPEKRPKWSLAVDHDAVSKQVRGLLCSGCNPGLGKFNHDPNLLVAAAHYLQKYINQPKKKVVMGKKKFESMREAFRNMSRAADNETPVSRAEFVKLVKKFERTYRAWRDLIPELASGTKSGGGKRADTAR